MSDGADRAVDSNARANRYIRVLATVTAAVLIALGVLSNLSAAKQRQTILECTTPGPHKPTAADPTTGHRCFDDNAKRTAGLIADLRRSMNCNTIYGDLAKRVPSCVEVDERLDAQLAGGDPFATDPATAPPTTTTTAPTKASNP